MTNRLIKKLTYDQQKGWHNKNNWSIFQSVLVANGATTYKYPMSDLARADEKLSFSGNMREPWQQIGQDIDGETFSDLSGFSLSMSADGSIVAIGAPNNDGNGNNSGHVRIYQHTPNKTEADEDGPIGWSRLGRDIDGEEANYHSGAAVSLNSDGSTLAIGGPKDSSESDDTPRVRVYKFTGWGLGA